MSPLDIPVEVKEVRPLYNQHKRFFLYCGGMRLTLYQHSTINTWFVSDYNGYCPRENDFGVLAALEAKIHELAFGPPALDFQI